MKKKPKTGIWSLFISDLEADTIYKYEITTSDNKKFHKIDPYAFQYGISPDFSCIVTDLSKYKWNDHKWQNEKVSRNKWQQPISIYEVHAGSWRRNNNGQYYSYIELIDNLIDYVKCLGYTHIELMPITEHPFDGSWGYQCTGYFAPNSRFGKNDDFMYFIDCCHQAEIGVILDWVPSHFCRDQHGLAWYDGSPCYEYNSYKRSINNDWGSINFAIGKSKVRNFLISSALFWLDKYHIDGFRVDSVADILNARNRGKDVGKKFLSTLNSVINAQYPGTITIAEDSSINQHITEEGENGIGFTYCWNMGWTHDIITYMRHKPSDRKNYHEKLEFTLKYAHNQNFILPLSHDEMAYKRGSLIEKMPGNSNDKLKNLKLLLAWQVIHPGKQLMFMGTEIAQETSWRFDRQLDWKRLKYKKYKTLHKLIQQLNKIYNNHPALWQLDKGDQGTIIQSSDPSNSIIILRRQGWNTKDFLIIAANFSNKNQKNYFVGVPLSGIYDVILSTNWKDFEVGDLTQQNREVENYHWQNLPYRINIEIPALSLLIIKQDTS